MQVTEERLVCGCKGIRTCLICESYKESSENDVKNKIRFFYCPKCKIACTNLHSTEKGHTVAGSETLSVEGILVLEGFLSAAEETELMQTIDNHTWTASQSGRHKQDFGPKVNFKKQKINASSFKGFPISVQPLITKIQKADPLLNDFFPVELCNLEYVPERGAAIDPHVDDAWLWGERLITVNMLSDTCLTLTPCDLTRLGIELIIPMPRYSLIALHGEARHNWYHAIARKDITHRRIAMTFRELSEHFLGNGLYVDVGKQLLSIANTFF